jgi:protein O-GlcNAc transferase
MFRWLFANRGPSQPAAAVGGAPTIEEALAHHRAGRLPEAEALYRRILDFEPANIDAAHFLGVLAYQRGDLAQAAERISAALARNPANAPARNNLGNVLDAQGRHDDALRCYLEAVALEPDYVDARSNLAAALARRARTGAQAALAQVDAGNAHKDAGRLDQALACYDKSVALAPDLTAGYLNTASTLAQLGRPRDALPWFRKALALEPELPEALYGLGMAASRAGDAAGAKAALSRYLRLEPNDEPAMLALAEAHASSFELDPARACFERALEANPGRAGAHIGLGNVLRNQGRLADAIGEYRLALERDPGAVVAHQNLLFCMMCTSAYSARDVYEEHLEFARRFERPLAGASASHSNAPDARRRLRVGYVSPDLRRNIVGYYVEPILRHHDHDGFEIFCYHTGARDAFSEELAGLVGGWRDVGPLSDDAIAARVREDRIDILVDLCGHGAGNRVLVFARRPAPVQASYLDYSTTTGLESIEWRLTTEYCDPPGADAYYSEKLVRLPGTYWTYNPPLRPPISPPPSRANGHVTFGSFNLYYRITPEVIALWARVLLAVPGSRLVIVGVAEGSTQAALLAALAAAGVDPGRVSAHSVVPFGKYNELLASVDIALTPFPYNGATTMMDCLWNGVPAVALKGGETFYSRIGCSILEEAGLGRLIAEDGDDYVRIAADLAADAGARERLRASLRETMERSRLRDFAGFTRGLEAAYREMWAAWCASRRESS